MAETQRHDVASVKLPKKVGFVHAGEDSEAGLLRFDFAP